MQWFEDLTYQERSKGWSVRVEFYVLRRNHPNVSAFNKDVSQQDPADRSNRLRRMRTNRCGCLRTRVRNLDSAGGFLREDIVDRPYIRLQGMDLRLVLGNLLCTTGAQL